MVWTPFDYLAPLASLTPPSPAAMPRPAAALLLLWTLPFVWIGVVMSARRARDAGLPPWLAVAFFIPVLNYILMLTLAAMPSVPAAVRQPVAAAGAGPAPFDGQAAAAVLGGAGCAIGMVLIGVYTMKVYGLTLFLGAPFVLGLVTGWMANRDGSRGHGRNAVLTTLAVILAALALIGLALEGAVCLILSIPLALPLAYLGGAIGERIADQRRSWRGGMALLLILAPGGAAIDRARDHPAERVVLTSIVVNAPAPVVWRQVIAFDDITEAPEWYFRAGLAYPRRARIDGAGPGAVRYCEFSTGAFREPITEWIEPEKLAFDVTDQPPPVQEWSPYAHVYAPHLAGYFRTSHGEFRLTPLPGGRTRLEGRTWYTLRMAPAAYWNPIADAILHRIHQRVLRHIKSRAE